MCQHRTFVADVYDGDTITCDIDLGVFTLLRRQKFRLYDLDTLIRIVKGNTADG